MKRLTIYSTLFLALCLSAWGLSWYALTTLRSETRSMDRELSFFNEQEERYQKTIPQRIVDEKRFRQFPSTIEKFREMAVQHRQIAGRRQAVADGVFQKYLDKILASAKEREKRIILLQQITKQLEQEAQQLTHKPGLILLLPRHRQRI